MTHQQSGYKSSKNIKAWNNKLKTWWLLVQRKDKLLTKRNHAKAKWVILIKHIRRRKGWSIRIRIQRKMVKMLWYRGSLTPTFKNMKLIKNHKNKRAISGFQNCHKSPKVTKPKIYKITHTNHWRSTSIPNTC